ncbi:TAXI family TRAP transporter solute-binding subunit [Oceanobacillus sp. HCA-5259]|uniref:TAXI family TRAP transporter solute-binding subunit n=1 Tax=Oceanobacillus sp. HCA-5259 TaxID=3134661 RepID=UPI0030BF5B47
MMKKMVWNILIILFLLLLAACGGNESSGDSGDKLDAPDKFLTIGSGPMGSGWFPITTAMTDLYAGEFNNLNATQQEGGSTANLNSLEVGDIQMALNYTTDFNAALEGGPGFDKPLEEIAAIGTLYPVYQTLATTRNNDSINRIEDILDKHIFLGPQGGGGPVAFWQMMEEYGYDEKSVEEAGGKTSYGNYSDGASMLKDNNVDVLLAGGAPYVPALQEMEVTNPINVIEIDGDMLESLEAQGRGITAGALPGGTYDGIDEDIPTYVIETMLTVRADLDDEYVYHLTKIFWENLEYFEQQVPERAKDFSLDTALNGIDPEDLHPGARKYYEEMDVLE